MLHPLLLTRRCLVECVQDQQFILNEYGPNSVLVGVVHKLAYLFVASVHGAAFCNELPVDGAIRPLIYIVFVHVV